MYYFVHVTLNTGDPVMCEYPKTLPRRYRVYEKTDRHSLSKVSFMTVKSELLNQYIHTRLCFNL